jgi:hypothetical protein
MAMCAIKVINQLIIQSIKPLRRNLHQTYVYVFEVVFMPHKPAALSVQSEPLFQKHRHLADLLFAVVVLGKEDFLQHLHHLDDVAARVRVELSP